jgi:hypothetical protein
LRKIYFLLLLIPCLCFKANAQVSPFGEIDIADLKLTTCSFEKSANAMILFDVAKVTYDNSWGINMNRHKRIKIFNADGVSAANVRIEYWGGGRDEIIKNVEAATYNLVNNKLEKTVLEKDQQFTVKIDKQRKALVFTFPNIKAGSVVEYKYTLYTRYSYNYPNWFFQMNIPTRYSEFDGGFEFGYRINAVKKLTQPLVIDSTLSVKRGTRHIWAMANIPSFRLEPYMHSIEDNLQSIYFKPVGRFNSWEYVTIEILNDEDFGLQLVKKLDNEEEIIAKAKALKTDNEKMAFLFDTVKNTVKWNDEDRWFTKDGIQKAWTKKTGNSTEINLILYRFLKSSGINPKLIVLGTREHGELELDNAGFGRLNKTVVQVPIDSLNYFVLDATAKYNTYNSTPYELLGLNMLSIDPGTKGFNLIKLQNNQQSEEVIFVNAEIKSGKLAGTTQLSSSNYKRIDKLLLYDKLGEKKYIDDVLKNNDDAIKIDSFKVNMQVDTLPLREDFNFKMDLTGVDGDYIYFNPNIFTGLGPNPFLSEARFSDIDFVYLNKYIINGRYKIPAGYKIDALPKQLTIIMADKSISFNRTIGEMEGAIIVHYVISFAKAKYKREEYPALRDFYKKMYELLNEQIVLKKS